MTVVLIMTTVMKYDQVWVPYLRAFAEAAIVGVCALVVYAAPAARGPAGRRENQGDRQIIGRDIKMTDQQEVDDPDGIRLRRGSCSFDVRFKA